MTATLWESHTTAAGVKPTTDPFVYVQRDQWIFRKRSQVFIVGQYMFHWSCICHLKAGYLYLQPSTYVRLFFYLNFKSLARDNQSDGQLYLRSCLLDWIYT